MHLPKLVSSVVILQRSSMNVLDIYVGADIEIVALISDWKYVTLISIIHHLFAALTQPSQKLTRIISIH